MNNKAIFEEDNQFETLLENKTQILISSLMWMFLTVSDDIRYMFLPYFLDSYLDIIETSMLIFFLVEMTFSFANIRNQGSSFLFFVDSVACLSVLPDIEFIWNLYERKLTLDELIAMPYDEIETNEVGGSALNLVGNAFKIFRSAALIAKIQRIQKLQHIHNTQAEQKRDSKGLYRNPISEEEVSIVKESSMTKRIISRLNQNIFIFIIIPIFIFEFLKVTIDPSFNQYQELNSITQQWDMFKGDEGQDFEGAFSTLLANHGDSGNRNVTPDFMSPIMQFKTDPELFGKLLPEETKEQFINPSLSKEQQEQRPAVLQVVKGDQNSVLVVLVQHQYFNKSAVNLSVNLLILVILTVAFQDFFNLISSVVLTPIEDIVRFVHATIDNPLNIGTINRDYHALKEIRQKEEAQSIESWINSNQMTQIARLNQRQSETKKLETAVSKICNLLVLGVGEAGQDLISHTLRQPDMSSHQSLQNMLKGKCIQAIYGFCDIRNFTTTTETLQEKVLEQVNTIAEVIHRNVDVFMGKPNKNIGDAFLIVWKFDQQRIKVEENCLVGNEYTAVMADFALIATIKCVYDIFQDKKIHKLDTQVQSLKNGGMKRSSKPFEMFETKLGFGLHVGAAQEGALGSEHKIDCTYLSAEVKTSETLESSTKEQGVNMLLSENFTCLLPEKTKSHLRKVDQIQLDGNWGQIQTQDIMKDTNKQKEAGFLEITHNSRASHLSQEIEESVKGKNEHLIFQEEYSVKPLFDSAFAHWVVARNLFGSPDVKLNLMKDQQRFKKIQESALQDLVNGNKKECLEKVNSIENNWNDYKVFTKAIKLKSNVIDC